MAASGALSPRSPSAFGEVQEGGYAALETMVLTLKGRQDSLDESMQRWFAGLRAELYDLRQEVRGLAFVADTTIGAATWRYHDAHGSHPFL